jgi:hypothetical protein
MNTFQALLIFNLAAWQRRSRTAMTVLLAVMRVVSVLIANAFSCSNAAALVTDEAGGNLRVAKPTSTDAILPAALLLQLLLLLKLLLLKLLQLTSSCKLRLQELLLLKPLCKSLLPTRPRATLRCAWLWGIRMMT